MDDVMTTERGRRSRDRFWYSPDQLLRRTPIYTRRRKDKLRLASHMTVVLACICLSVWWVVPLHSFAGPVLVTLSPRHGVHAGDLAMFVFVAVALRPVVLAGRDRALPARD